MSARTILLLLALAPPALAQSRLHEVLPTPATGAPRAVAGTGDLNGDGRADFVIGYPEAGSGRALVYSGRTGALLIELAGGPGAAAFGAAVAGGTDVSGDGIPELLVGDPSDDIAGPNIGSAALINGRNGVLINRFYGGPQDQLGASLAFPGDVDRDGFEDLLVGAPQRSLMVSHKGYANVYSGRNGALLYHFTGDTDFDEFGTSVAGAGDVDADGAPDLVVGAPNSIYGGYVRVFSGRDGSILWDLRAGRPLYALGLHVAGAGDVDGDGHADFMAGMYASGGPQSFVYSGATGGLLYGFTSPPTGNTVAGPGDMNGDGVPDLVIGAPSYSELATNGGSVAVYSGSDGALLYTFESALGGARLGSAVAGAGDVDGDGLADLVSSGDGSANPLTLVLGLHALQMTAVSPGVAGVVNTVDVGGAQPGASVFLLSSTSAAPLDAPGCNGLVLRAGAHPQVLRGTAGPSGNLRFAGRVPASLSGATLFLQAWQPAECIVSQAQSVTLL